MLRQAVEKGQSHISGSLRVTFLPICAAPAGVGNSDDENTLADHSVDDTKREPFQGALPMIIVDLPELSRTGNNARHGRVNCICETRRGYGASFRIPIKRLVKIASRSGKQINRRHPAPS